MTQNTHAKRLEECLTRDEVLSYMLAVPVCKRSHSLLDKCLKRMDEIHAPKVAHFYDAHNWEFTAEELGLVMEGAPIGEVIKVGRLAEITPLWCANVWGPDGIQKILQAETEDQLKELVYNHNKENEYD